MLRLRYSTAIALVCLCLSVSLVSAAAVGPGVAATASHHAALTPPGDNHPTLSQAQPTADTTVTRIRLSENGTARWTVQIRTALDTQERVEEYRAFQERFRANTSRYLDPFQTRITGTVRTAANATGREMRATDFSASTDIQELPRRWGIVTYEFTWTNFAVTEEGSVAVGDVFGSGFFLADGDTLELVAPPGYEFTEVAPEPDQSESDVVAWTDRTDFTADHPQATAVPTDGASDPGGDDGDAASSLLDPSPFLVAVALVVLVSIAGGVLWYRRRPSSSGDSTPQTGGDEDRVPQQSPSEAKDASDTAGQSADQTGSAGAVAGDELLTDADRVERLLDEAGGRMKQADVADELDWSASKTSRVVAEMAEEGTVTKFRIGRENVLERTDDDLSNQS